MKRVGFFDSPVLSVQVSPWRAKLVVVCLMLGFVALIAKALHVQGLSTEFLQQQGERRYERTLVLPAMRGKIYDRTGSVVLASSVPVRAIWAIPEDAKGATKEQLSELAGLLGMRVPDIEHRLADDSKTFVYIKRQVAVDVADKVRSLKVP